jgi:DNA-binding response OmpR family regulator
MNKNTKPKILYVEDDLSLSYVTQDNLELRGYDLTFCEDGKKAFETFKNQKFDLCILDVMLPEMDGFELARKIREVDEHIPIIFLSAKSLKEDRIEGLTIGGDDYITKPFSIEELVLKIEVFLRRSKITNNEQAKTPGIFRFGVFTFDFNKLTLSSPKGPKRLTSREADLLRYLLKNQNKVLKKEEILTDVWESHSYFNSRSLDVFISKLRKYLNEDPSIKINNVHGIGFILNIE